MYPRRVLTQTEDEQLANGKATFEVCCSLKLAESLEVAHVGEIGDEIQEEMLLRLVISLEWNKGVW